MSLSSSKHIKKLLSLFLIGAIILPSCTAIKETAGYGIDRAGSALHANGYVTGEVKKAAIPEKNSWDSGDGSASLDIVYNALNSQKYLNELFDNLQKIAGTDDLSVYMLRTARVQGLESYGAVVKITRGMFNMINDEAELAGLMGHEIGHVVLKHDEAAANSQRELSNASDSVINNTIAPSKARYIIKQQTEASLNSAWSKEQEEEADRYGAELAAKAGYDPYALCDLFERLSTRVDLGIAYRVSKLESSHPALDERAKSLREYLESKGYTREGKLNHQEYVAGMSDLLAMRTGEGGKENAKLQAESKKDLARLDEIYKEIERYRASNTSMLSERFMAIMDEVSAINQKYSITAQDLSAVKTNDKEFMEEVIFQDDPFWNILYFLKSQISEKEAAILDMLGHVAVGLIPGVGEAVGVYELISGRDIFTGEKLSDLERAAIAFGLLIGVGSEFKGFASGLDAELMQMSATAEREAGALEGQAARQTAKYTAEEIEKAQVAVNKALKDVDITNGWKEVSPEIANKVYVKPPYGEASYMEEISAYDGVLKNDEVFYRVYTKNQKGSFLMRTDPSGISPTELQDNYALFKEPKYVDKVTVPAGTNIRAGIVARNTLGNGGKVQWEILSKDGKNIVENSAQQLEDIGVLFENSSPLK